MANKGKYYDSLLEEAKQIAAETVRPSREACPTLLQHIIHS